MALVSFDDISEPRQLFSPGGIIGAFMTGLFADLNVNPAGANGAFFGRPIQMWYQIAGILTAIGKIRSSFVIDSLDQLL